MPKIFFKLRLCLIFKNLNEDYTPLSYFNSTAHGKSSNRVASPPKILSPSVSASMSYAPQLDGTLFFKTSSQASGIISGGFEVVSWVVAVEQQQTYGLLL